MNEIEQLKQRISELENLFKNHIHTGIDSPSLGLPDKLKTAPLAAISAPSGGATVDSQSRSSINLIISRLQSLGLTL